MNDSAPFLRPRFVGPRFEGHAIPLDILKDLAVLEEMVVEVAKWHYLEANPDRTRSPRGFTEGVSLSLTQISEGSTVLDIDFSPKSGGLFPTSTEFYVKEARDSILNAIDAAETDQSITQFLPERVLVYFDRIGRGLRDGDAIEFTPTRSGRPARLTKNTRRKLIFSSSVAQDLTEEVTLRGTVPEADRERMTFQLKLFNGRRVGARIEPQHLGVVLDAFNSYGEGVRVLLEGIARLSRLNRLQAVETVEHISLLDPNDIAARTEELADLKDGWLDGKGIAPADSGLKWLSDAFDSYYDQDLPLPYLYPTAEGGIQAEWSLGNYEISVDVNIESHQGEWNFLDLLSKKQEERIIDLSDSGDWEWLAERIRSLTEGEQ